MANIKDIEKIFERGTVVEVLPSKEAFIERLLSGKPLKIYYGIDPTGKSIHLGHAKNIIFLEELRQLGCEVIVLFGDFTATIGDPSGKASARKQLSYDEVKDNMADWINHISPLIDFKHAKNPAKVMYNSTWLSKLDFKDIVSLSSNFTVQQMLERDMFEKRINEKAPIYIHEFMYALMQGYDSVAMDVDAELCGTDQIFNALAGRTLMRRMKDKEKFVVALNLVANPKTGELMSKSNNTGVFINLPPNELFGAIMALPDPMIEPLFINCTRIPMEEKGDLMALGPREAKAKIAFDIVKRFHGEDTAKKAEESFNSTFSKGGVPENIPEIKLSGSNLVDALIKEGIVPSKTEWRRLIADGAVRDESDNKITDANFTPTSGMVLKIGKRRFVRIV